MCSSRRYHRRDDADFIPRVCHVSKDPDLLFTSGEILFETSSMYGDVFHRDALMYNRGRRHSRICSSSRCLEDDDDEKTILEERLYSFLSPTGMVEGILPDWDWVDAMLGSSGIAQDEVPDSDWRAKGNMALLQTWRDHLLYLPADKYDCLRFGCSDSCGNNCSCLVITTM